MVIIKTKRGRQISGVPFIFSGLDGSRAVRSGSRFCFYPGVSSHCIPSLPYLKLNMVTRSGKVIDRTIANLKEVRLKYGLIVKDDLKSGNFCSLGGWISQNFGPNGQIGSFSLRFHVRDCPKLAGMATPSVLGQVHLELG